MPACSLSAVLVAVTVMLGVATHAADNDTVSAGTVAYVGMSASVLAPASHFDRDVFVRELSSAALVDSRRLDVVTFYPSSNDSLTIVDFVVLQDAEGSAVSIAARILITAVETERLVIESIIADPSVVYNPPNITLAALLDGTNAFSSRDPRHAPQTIMWLCTALWLLFVVVYVVFHRLVVLQDRRLYVEMYPPLEDAHACFMLMPSHAQVPEGRFDVAGASTDAVVGAADTQSAMSVVLLDEPLGCIAAGNRHVCFTTAKGVFVWGENTWGQLGLAKVSAFEQLPPRCAYDCHDDDSNSQSFFIPAPRASAPRGHSSLEEESSPEQACYGWELKANAGTLVCQAVRHWQLEDDGRVVHGVACGAMHTLWWTNEGIYACGSNAYGQLGVTLDERMSKAFPSDVVPVLQKIDASLFCGGTVVSIAAGAYHSAVLTTTGVYVFGNHLDGQLLEHRGPNATTVPSPRNAFGVQRVPLECILRDLSLGQPPHCAEQGGVAVAAIACFGGRTAVRLASGTVICNTTVAEDAFLRRCGGPSSSNRSATGPCAQFLVIPDCTEFMVANDKLVLRRGDAVREGDCYNDRVILPAAADVPSSVLRLPVVKHSSGDPGGRVAGVAFLPRQQPTCVAQEEEASSVAVVYTHHHSAPQVSLAARLFARISGRCMLSHTAVRVAVQRGSVLPSNTSIAKDVDLAFDVPMPQRRKTTTPQSASNAEQTPPPLQPLLLPACATTIVSLPPHGLSLVVL